MREISPADRARIRKLIADAKAYEAELDEEYADILPPRVDLIADKKKLRQDAFLHAFTETGELDKSCKRAGVTISAHYGWLGELSSQPFRNGGHKTPDQLAYTARFETAKLSALAYAESELKRRAIDGDLRPVGWYQGVPGAYVREKSDTLLMFMLKALAPDKYRENRRLELTGANGGPINITQSPIPLDRLSPSAQAEILFILERELGPDLEKFAGAGDTTTTKLLETAISDDEDDNFLDIPPAEPSIPLKDVYSPDEIDERLFQLSNSPDELIDDPRKPFPFWGLRDIALFLQTER